MATFYTGVDKSIYQGGDHYVPMERFRLNPYEQKNLSYESQPQSYGITNTNAFTNSGGRGGGIGGNVFGYGSAIKPGDPSVLTSGPYAGQSGYYGSLNYSGGLPGDIAQQGPGRHFEYDDSGEFYRDYSLTPKKEIPGFIKGLAGFVPFGMSGVNFLEKRMNPEGPLTLDDVNRSTYKIAGLSDLDKTAYNELAGQGMLFEGPGGIKTATGKNFGATGYFEGQKEIWDKEYAGKTEDDIEADLKAYAEKHNIKNWQNTYKAKKYYEAKTMRDYQDKQKQKELDEKNKKIVDQNYDANVHGPTDYGKGSDGKQSYDTGQGFGAHATSGGPVSNKTGRGRQDWADGGRIGFFAHGGRVYLNLGGLASIL